MTGKLLLRRGAVGWMAALGDYSEETGHPINGWHFGSLRMAAA